MGFSRFLPPLVALIFIGTLLSGCGGGGGGGSAGGSGGGSGIRPPLPELAQESLPSGLRTDRRADNYFPAQAGDRWVYDRYVGAVLAGETTRNVIQAFGTDFVVSEIGGGENNQYTYRRSSEGLENLSLLDGFAQRGVAAIVEYAEPFYPIGSTRRVTRQGALFDYDGDGVAESFRLELQQTLIGFETVTLSVGPIKDAAHFRNVYTVSVFPSDLEVPVFAIVTTEDVWHAPGIGVVQLTSSSRDESGAVVEPLYTLRLRSGVVAGQTLFQPPPDGNLKKIPLTHTALVFDAPRQRYLASIPASVPSVGNRIAIIDAVSGSLTYSGLIGSEPAALAVTDDGSALLVGLNGSSELVKLRLPDFVEQWRVALPSGGFFGASRVEQIAVSPLDPNVVAVSLYWSSVSPRHAGVYLIRAGVLQPLSTQSHTGGNLIAFDKDGTQLYGYNNETTEFGLRRIALLTNGLQQELVVASTESSFGVNTIDRVGVNGGRVLFGRSLYTTPGLSLSAQVGVGASGCRWHAAAARIVCLGSTATNDRTILVVDPASTVIVNTPVFERASFSMTEIGQIVPGGSGMVALRVGSASIYQPASGIWLFSSGLIP